jgi:hypothetical protein
MIRSPGPSRIVAGGQNRASPPRRSCPERRTGSGGISSFQGEEPPPSSCGRLPESSDAAALGLGVDDELADLRDLIVDRLFDLAGDPVGFGDGSVCGEGECDEADDAEVAVEESELARL